MDPDVVETLDLAIEAARDLGYQVDGWTLQREEAGYAAWLYWEDDLNNTQGYVFGGVEVLSTPIAAARYCLSRATALPSKLAEIDN